MSEIPSELSPEREAILSKIQQAFEHLCDINHLNPREIMTILTVLSFRNIVTSTSDPLAAADHFRKILIDRINHFYEMFNE